MSSYLIKFNLFPPLIYSTFSSTSIMPSDCEIEEIIPEPVVLNFSKIACYFFQ